MNGITVGFAMCGSFCTIGRALEEMKKLRELGYEIVPETSVADVYVVNTCTVTNLADRKSRQFIRRGGDVRY